MKCGDVVHVLWLNLFCCAYASNFMNKMKKYFPILWSQFVAGPQMNATQSFFCFVNQLANDATSIDIIRYFLLTCFRCNFVCFFFLLSRQRDCLCLHPILVTIKFIIIVFHCCKNANCSFLLSIWCFFFVCLFFH